MLLIDCPYCGERPEIEFAYGGQAHLARPARPAELDDAGVGANFSTCATNTKGVHAERWRHARGCGRFFNALRDTTTDHFLATYKTGEAAAVARAMPRTLHHEFPHGGARRAHRSQRGRCDSPSTADPMAASRATPSPRRCSPTACT